MKVRGQTVYSLKERLERLSKVDEATGCINWTSTTRNGYGSLMVGSRSDGTSRTAKAHRLAYEIENGPIPEGLHICHRCDNPACINPQHLFAGTRQDNTDDREAKGRNNPPRGEKQAHAKLSEVDILAIRRLRASGHIFAEIAERFDIDKSTARRAAKGQSWIHVAPAAPAIHEGGEG
ncbi:MAG: HNH endonuclease [Pseudomonadota bacterium]